MSADGLKTGSIDDTQEELSVMLQIENSNENNDVSYGSLESQELVKREDFMPLILCNCNSVLPYWLLYIAWTLSLTASVVASFFVCLYGLKFSYKESVQWLTSFFTSFFTSACIIQPIKVVCLAAVIAYIFRNPIQVDDRKQEIPEETDELLHDEVQRTWRERPSRPHHIYQPQPQETVQLMRQMRAKEIRMRQMVKEMLLYLSFVVSLSIIVYSHLANSGYHVFKTAYDTYVAAAYRGDIRFDEVSNVDDMWLYVNDTLIPSLYPATWYNDEAFITDSPLSSDLVTVLFSPVRLRQVRMKGDICSVLPAMTHRITHCHGEFSLRNVEKENYAAGWRPLLNQSLAGVAAHWQFQSAFQLRTSPLFAKYATYAGSGYVAVLKKNKTEAQGLITVLADSGWVDERTAAVIIEFTTYNSNTNTFTIVALVFEFLATGAVAPYHSITPTTLHHFTDELRILSLICEVIYVFFIFFFTYQQGKLIKRLTVKGYFSEPFNYVEFSILLLSYTAFVVYFVRYVSVNDTIADYHDHKEKFVSFYLAAFWTSCLGYLLAALQMLTIIKFVQLISFNAYTLILIATLHYLVRPLSHYFLIMFIVVVAFGSFAALCFGTKFYDFSDIFHTFIRLFTVFIGEFDDFDDFYTETGAMGGWFFVVMIVVFYYLLLNVMLAVIVDSFFFIKHRFQADISDYDFLSFVWNRFLLWSGLGTPRPGVLLNNELIKAAQQTTAQQLQRQRRKRVRFAEDI